MATATKELSISPQRSSVASRDELPYRLRQQSLLSEFGRSAMQTRDIARILQRATELCAEGLETTFAKVLEYEAANDRLVVRGGVGWRPGTINDVSLGADIGSPAGYAYHTGQMVISNHLQDEARFRTPQLLADHGIRRAINVLIERGGEGSRPFGVLEVDSPDPGQFDQADAEFLAGFAGLLGIAIERQAADAKLQEALEYQAMLAREMSHRVKNSLASVVSLLRVQARTSQSHEVNAALDVAASRVATIANVHDLLWRSHQVGFIDLADFLSELCKKLDGTGEHTLVCDAESLIISADRAVPLGLLVNELVSNAIKYAYPGDKGAIAVSAHEIKGLLQVRVSDNGVGLPDGFDIDEPRKSFGFKVIGALVRQLEGHLAVVKQSKGACFVLDMPMLPKQQQES
jgi:two-component sensor histidine kinase